MRQFDVFRNPSERSSDYAPFLLVLQSTLTMTETTVIVAPLVLPSRLPSVSRLFPRVRVGSRQLVLSTSELGAVACQRLGQRVGNLERERDNIIAAIDMLFSGF